MKVVIFSIFHLASLFSSTTVIRHSLHDYDNDYGSGSGEEIIYKLDGILDDNQFVGVEFDY